MPTLADLQAESWWGREIITPELHDLGNRLAAHFSRPATAVGTKGDANHLRGAHRSQEWIKNSRYCTNRTYTVQSGLTADQARYIAGLDFTPGSDTAMITQCKRIYAAVKSGQLEAVREFYGNINGDQIVDGWDNVKDIPATSDSSHLWHWHLSLDRTKLRDTATMDRIYAVVTGNPLEDELAASDDILAELRSLRTDLTNLRNDLDNRVAAGGLDPQNALFFFLRSIVDSQDPQLATVWPDWVTDRRYGLAQIMKKLEEMDTPNAEEIARALVKVLGGGQ